jgi:putative addiction module component (TIGR02574 family)
VNAILFDAARALPLSERIELAEALWESIAEAGYEPPLSEAQAAELDRRLEEHRRNPQTAIPWTEIRAELERKYAPRG